jgi:hypothetical protein
MYADRTKHTGGPQAARGLKNSDLDSASTLIKKRHAVLADLEG